MDSYSHWEDIKDDINGACTKFLSTWTVECHKAANELEIKVVAKKALARTKSEQYHLLLNSKENKACPSLVGLIFLLKNSNYKIVKEAALLRYHINSGEEKVDLHMGVHGNSRASDNLR